MPAAWAGVGLSAIGLGSSLFGSGGSNDAAAVAQANATAADNAKMMNQYNEDQAALGYTNMMTPLSGLQGYSNTAYTPQLVNYGSVPNPNLTPLDQSDLNSRYAALGQLSREATAPGFTPADNLLLQQASQPTANALLSAANTQAQNVRSQMNGGDAGTQYLLGAQAEQGIGNSLASMGASAFGNSLNSKLNALGNISTQYGNIQAGTQALNQQNNSLLNARDFNQYLSNQQATNNNTNALNSAQQYNIANQQRVTGLNNSNITAENASNNNILASKANAVMNYAVPMNTTLGQESAADAAQAAGYGAQGNAYNASAMNQLGGMANQFMNPNSGISQAFNGLFSSPAGGYTNPASGSLMDVSNAPASANITNPSFDWSMYNVPGQ